MTKNLVQNMNEFSHFACDTDVEEIALSYRHATSAAHYALRHSPTDATRQSLWKNGFQNLYTHTPELT